jgi:general secretion pathway protein A
MYERFYGLTERPFDLTPNPRFLYLTERHREALSSLQYGIVGRRGVTLLIGEAGTGKTTIVRAALDAVAGPNSLLVYLNNPTLSRTEFFELLAAKLDLAPEARHSKARFLLELEHAVQARHAGGGVTALVVDEAQSLPHELIEEIRLLANVESQTEKLLPVVLAGQPELAARLEQEDLRQLKQRIALRCELAALEIRETAAYIAGRLKIAGGDSAKIFTREAVQTIHERSRGIPRTISVICDNALVTGFAGGIRPVGSHVILEVCHDFRLPTVKEGPPSSVLFARRDLRLAKSDSYAEGADGSGGDERPNASEKVVDDRISVPRRDPGASGAPAAAQRAADDQHEQTDRLFSSYTKKKRFRFF